MHRDGSWQLLTMQITSFMHWRKWWWQRGHYVPRNDVRVVLYITFHENCIFPSEHWLQLKFQSQHEHSGCVLNMLEMAVSTPSLNLARSIFPSSVLDSLASTLCNVRSILEPISRNVRPHTNQTQAGWISSSAPIPIKYLDSFFFSPDVTGHDVTLKNIKRRLIETDSTGSVTF